jgi:DNA ligase (NAD+)
MDSRFHGNDGGLCLPLTTLQNPSILLSMTPSNFLKQLAELRPEELVAVKGIGEVLAQNVVAFCKSERYQQMLAKFERLETEGKAPELVIKELTADQLAAAKLRGQTICITGSFDLPRPQIKEVLEALGAKVVDSVTKNTTMLLCGADAGSKLQKAESLGIKVVRELEEILEG